jgi:hypothetical protein
MVMVIVRVRLVARSQAGLEGMTYVEINVRTALKV